MNLVSRLLERRRADGSYRDWPNSTAFAVIALRAAGATGGLRHSLSWLRGVQNDDGGWGDVPGSPSTADGTGAAMQALAPRLQGRRPRDRVPAPQPAPRRRLVARRQRRVNSQSTAWAIQGIIAAGGNPANYRRGGASALDYLAARQQSDGHYRYSRSSDQTPIWVTAEVLPAVAGDSFPIAAPPRAPKPKPSSRKSSAQPGGLAPGGEAPGAPAQPGSASPGPAPSGEAGSAPKRPARPAAHKASGPAASGPVSGGSPSAAQGAGGAAGEASAPGSREGAGASSGTEAASHGSDGTAGAILLGLLAGCLLFGAAWAARTAWMRWRYGA